MESPGYKYPKDMQIYKCKYKYKYTNTVLVKVHRPNCIELVKINKELDKTKGSGGKKRGAKELETGVLTIPVTRVSDVLWTCEGWLILN